MIVLETGVAVAEFIDRMREWGREKVESGTRQCGFKQDHQMVRYLSVNDFKVGDRETR